MPTPSFPIPKRYGLLNARGLWSLYLKEVLRFLTVWTQTLIAPAVTALLFFTIFSVAIERAHNIPSDWSFQQFIVPGLIMMSVIQNAFANTSSSLMIGKLQRNIMDVLLPPISAFELTLGYMLAGLTRGVLVGLFLLVVMNGFVSLPFSHPFFILFHLFAASMWLSLVGMAGGLWAEKFDHISMVTNFIVIPGSFLSGTFYSLRSLPEIFQTVALFNPFFHMIDGFRFGFIGHADSDPVLGLVVMCVMNLLTFLGVWSLIERGYKIKD